MLLLLSLYPNAAVAKYDREMPEKSAKEARGSKAAPVDESPPGEEWWRSHLVLAMVRAARSERGTRLPQPRDAAAARLGGTSGARSSHSPAALL